MTNAATASILTPVGRSIAAEGARAGGYSTATFARFGIPLLVAVVAAASAVSYLLLR